MKKTIYLIRHGETEYNRLGIVQGSGVDSDLNETGLRQAGLFFEKYKDLPFEKIYTSKLKRAIRSVESFIQKGIPHTALYGLNEISWGEYEGQKSQTEWKEEYNNMVYQWSSGNLEFRIPGGENPLELQERQKPVLDEIKKTKESLLLVCMHGRALKSFLCLMLQKPLHYMENFQHHNLCLYVVEFDGNNFNIRLENNISHLLEE
jgi:probable phosphoglycerate mutase